MISAEDWWNIIGNYNNSIFPVQIFFHAILIVITILFFIKPNNKMNMIIKIYFTFSFAWIGIVLFLIFGSELSNNALSAFLFISISTFMGIDIFRKRIEFQIPNRKDIKIIMTILLIIIFCYPLFGYLFGHNFPQMMILGALPCPTTAFALILLAFSIPKIDLKPYILLLIWAIPFPIFIQIPQFGVYEDTIMLSSGLFALITLIINRRKLSKKNLI